MAAAADHKATCLYCGRENFLRNDTATCVSCYFEELIKDTSCFANLAPHMDLKQQHVYQQLQHEITEIDRRRQERHERKEFEAARVTYEEGDYDPAFDEAGGEGSESDEAQAEAKAEEAELKNDYDAKADEEAADEDDIIGDSDAEVDEEIVEDDDLRGEADAQADQDDATIGEAYEGPIAMRTRRRKRSDDDDEDESERRAKRARHD
jgi:hypothetical protein